MTDIYHRYFVFSRLQMEAMKERSTKLGRDIEFGKVVVGGVKKEYTDILLDMSQAKYPDSIKVAEGDIRRIVYTKSK
nr:MAG TPA: hypothetical protein [Caudoviricetes sp.]DAJ52647.1 MAG TPA: hypothetical protein [Caudoviricetes sp.]